MISRISPKGNLIVPDFGKDIKRFKSNLSRSFFMLLSLMFGLTWQFNVYAQELDYSDKSGKATEIIKNSQQYQGFLALQKKIAEKHGKRVRKFEVYVDGVNSKLIKSKDDLTDVSYSAFPYLNFDKKNKLNKFEFLRDSIVLSEKGHVIYFSFTPKYKSEIKYVIENFENLIGVSINKDKTGLLNLDLSYLEYLSFFKVNDSSYEKIIFPIKNNLISLEALFTPVNEFKNLINLNLLENLVLRKVELINLNDLLNVKTLVRIDVSGSGKNMTGVLDLSHYQNLIFLSFNSKYVKEVKGIETLNKLERLYVGESFNFKGVDFPNSLIQLQLAGKENTEFPNLKENVNLKILSITSTNIKRIDKIYNLINLEELNLFGNKIEKISGLNNLKKLRELNLPSNKINKIEGLSKLDSLLKINLEYNEIIIIEGFEGLSKLKEILLGHNKIKSIEEINDLVGIELLSLYENPIETFDYSEVEMLNNTKILLYDTPVGDAMTKAEKKKYRKLNRQLSF